MAGRDQPGILLPRLHDGRRINLDPPFGEIERQLTTGYRSSATLVNTSGCRSIDRRPFVLSIL
jgi:hypothetical protein